MNIFPRKMAITVAKCATSIQTGRIALPESVGYNPIWVEAFILNAPLPLIVCTEDQQGVLTPIVRGALLFSLTHFLNGFGRLDDPKILTHLNGTHFQGLPLNVCMIFNNNPIQFEVIPHNNYVDMTPVADFIKHLHQES